MPEFTPSSVQAWQPVAGGVGFQNSWADSGNGDPCAYRLLPATRQVEIIGDLSVPTFAVDSTIFTLPTGFLPASVQGFIFDLITSTGTVGVKTPHGYVQVNGNVRAAQPSIPGASTGLTTRMALRAVISLDF